MHELNGEVRVATIWPNAETDLRRAGAMVMRSLGLALAILLSAHGTAFAVLGEESIAAQSRAGSFEKEFSVCCPIISADTHGISVRECWSVTAPGLTRDIAMDFAIVLLPHSLQDDALGPPAKDGDAWVYQASGGYRVVLREIQGLSAEDSVVEIEVQSPAWRGGAC